MKIANEVLVVMVTAPEIETARKLARLALEQKLAACANLVPGIESHYWWQGELASSNEVLILFKTSDRQAGGLEKLVRENHPYDTPEFVAIPPSRVNEKYLAWWLHSMQNPSEPPVQV